MTERAHGSMRRVCLAQAALPFVSVGLVFGLEVTGLVQSGQGGVHGAAVTFVNEGDPNEVYTDTTGRDGRYRIDIGVGTAVESDDGATPARFQLNQNYPNPFNPGTVISYELAVDASVQVDVYNSLGQRVRKLVNGSWQQAGAHSTVWDGRDDGGMAMGSGVYVYRITAGPFEAARRMVLIDGPNSQMPISPLPESDNAAGSLSTTGSAQPARRDEVLEGVPSSALIAAKIAQGSVTFRVSIDRYKLVPFEQTGVILKRGIDINFVVEEDTREGVVFLKEGQRQLFLDDFVIEEMSNLTLTMHRPEKKGAVIRPNWQEGEASIQTRSAPFWDPVEGVFKLWLIDGSYRISPDGLHWVTAPAGDTGARRVFFDPLDPDPERRYKSFHPDRLAVSPDGINWTVLGVTIPDASDESNFSLDLENRLYVATIKRSGPYGRSVYLTTSEDFENWSTPELMFHADEEDQELGHERITSRLADPTRLMPIPDHPPDYTVDVYNMGTFRYEGLYIGIPAMHHRHTVRPEEGDDTFFHVLQLTSTRDLSGGTYGTGDWKRLGDGQPWLDISPLDSGAYDTKCILPPSAPLLRGSDVPGAGGDDVIPDQLWFYYTGCKAEAAPDRFAINLAVLRRDGFFSLDAAEEEGVLLTKPLVWRGSTLWVNVSTEEGEVRVEVLDEAGNLLRQGWSEEQSVPVAEDGVRLPVRWQSEEDLAELKLQSVRLRFYVRDAELYAFWSE